MLSFPIVAFGAGHEWSVAVEKNGAYVPVREFEKAHPHFRGDAWFKIRVMNKAEANVPVGISLGRISDADETYVNGHLIGSTGFDLPDGRFMGHRARTYFVPSEMLASENEVMVHVKKVAADVVGVGPQDGEPVLGNYAQLQRPAMWRDILRIFLPLLLGFTAACFGVYHLFLHFYLRGKRGYLIHGLLILCFGVYAMCYSFWLYEIIAEKRIVLLLHCLSSFLGLYFLCDYYVDSADRRWRIYKKTMLVITVGYCFAALSRSTFDASLEVFMAWHPFLLLNLLVVFAFAVRQLWSAEMKKIYPTVSIGFFIVALVYDVLATNKIIQSEQIAIPTFILTLTASIFLLGRDFAFAYLDVEKTVEDRTSDLATALGKVKELEKFREQFFTNVSHDFKTPIAIALSHMEEISKTMGVREKNSLQGAQHAMVKLKNMVTELLENVKSDAGRLNLHWTAESPRKVFLDWLHEYEKLAEEKGIRVTEVFEVSPDTKMPLETKLLERVFANVVSNAFKFTPRNGEIIVRLRADASQLILEVEDSGPGVPLEERTRIFERFYQGSATDLKQHGGSGIGLSFAREVVQQLNGVVHVEDGDKYRSKFVVSLPRAQPLVANVVQAQRGEIPYPKAVPSPIDPQRPSVLVVEDNPEIAQIVAHVLELQYNVFFAENGKAALRQLEKFKVDCIVSDLMMPEMTGTELLQVVKEQISTKTIPFIILTSKSEEEEVVRHLHLGAQDYLAKPFANDTLMARVTTQIQNHRLREQMAASDKMISLGMLSAGISHEIRSPVQAAQNYIRWLEKTILAATGNGEADGRSSDESLAFLMEKKEKIRQVFEGSLSSMEKISQIVKSMGGYASSSLERGDQNIKELVDNAMTLLKHKAKKRKVST